MTCSRMTNMQNFGPGIHYSRMTNMQNFGPAKLYTSE